MCLYPPAKKRGPKNRQKNLLHNDISRVQKNDTINNLTERINNAENMLVDLNKVSDELTDKSRETFVQSFDKLSLSVTTTTDVYEPSNLLFSNFQETDNNNYINLQYGNSTNPIGRGIVFAEDPLHYFSQDVSHFYQSNNMFLASHSQSAFEGQSYVLPNFFEDNTPLSEVYSTLITEESTLTEKSSDKHSL
ncbi:26920_t:CDS:2 [Gigaspora margarita]|uniref:26920_t:CDS:1 n=1 Tax=Gigaspora margarita TaxID=4874 RepID=A0ABN7ULY9_GIGMA|nr:26920_t:CDS:2 [Gigaspora margarita]